MIKLAYIGATFLVFAATNAMIFQKESLKSSGQTVYLKLAPRDPRSLMMGDYMALNYEVSNGARGTAKGDGHVVITLDDKKVGTLARVYSGGALKPDERLLRFRDRSGFTQIGPQSFYFQEGHARYYERAVFGELRLADDGDCLLVGLCDEKLQLLGPKKK